MAKSTRVCYECKQVFRSEEVINYTSIGSTTAHNYCRKCLAEKQSREYFSMKVCEIFGIKTPGPRIWTERKRLQLTYGYTDNSIISCLEYIYQVKKMKKLANSLCLVNPKSMEEMKNWQATEKARANSIAVAIAATEQMHEYIVPMPEKKPIKTTTNLEDGLFDD